mmetsp:Transcript_35437/g.66140  ORF Transcript_35437/g.66140 Transcript_35437/m.66140 type:complete len:117 (-) Transcript_35437:206-556(-)
MPPFAVTTKELSVSLERRALGFSHERLTCTLPRCGYSFSSCWPVDSWFSWLSLALGVPRLPREGLEATETEERLVDAPISLNHNHYNMKEHTIQSINLTQIKSYDTPIGRKERLEI